MQHPSLTTFHLRRQLSSVHVRQIELSFRLYFICLVLCSSFFVLDLVIFIGFVYEFVYKILW
jgi:hypothetical protein